MSHYNNVKTDIKNQDFLVSSLQCLGFKPEVYEIAKQLEGYQGDKRAQTAEIIIPRKQVGRASNDIGFKRQDDGSFTAIISNYDRGKYGAKWLAKLKTEYGVARVISTAKKQYGCANPVIKTVGNKKILKFTLS